MIVEQLTFAGLENVTQMQAALRQVEIASKQQLIYLQDSDPGAVGSRRLWVTMAGVMKIRSLDNASWISIA